MSFPPMPNVADVLSLTLLGEKVVDTTTNFRGTVTGVAMYLYGSPRARVECAKADNTGVNEEWFDVGRLEIIEPRVVDGEEDEATDDEA
jgi:hypothetical protein